MREKEAERVIICVEKVNICTFWCREEGFSGSWVRDKEIKVRGRD
jgi:hypothetical protein